MSGHFLIEGKTWTICDDLGRIKINHMMVHAQIAEFLFQPNIGVNLSDWGHRVFQCFLAQGNLGLTNFCHVGSVIWKHPNSVIRWIIFKCSSHVGLLWKLSEL